MSELPAGWAEASIGDLADLNPKQAFDDETIAGFVPMSHAPTKFLDKLRFDERPWGEIKKAYTNFKDGDVIFAKVTPCFENGKAAYVEGLPNGVGAGSSEFFVLRPSCDDVSAKYLLALVKSHNFLREGAENMTGAVGLRRVPKQFVEKYPMPVPPAAEQTRIAAKLDELLAQVDTLKARIDGIPALLKRFRQSVLAAAVSGRLTEEWRQRNSGSISAEQLLKNVMNNRQLVWQAEQLQKMAGKDTSVSDETWKGRYKEPASGYFDPLDLALPKNLPSSWKVTNLDSVAKVVTGNTPPTADPANWGGNIPFISPSQIHKLGNILDPTRYVTAEGAKIVRPLPKGTTLIVCIGTIGKVGLLDRTSIVNQQINALVPYEGIDAQYLNIWAKTLYSWLVATASATVNAAILNKARLAEAPFPLPSELEQTEIVRRVEQLFAFADQLEARVKAAQARIDRLTQSILAKAFRGELVPQDPDDEPASVLLERIKAQRAAAPKAKRGRRAATPN